MIVLTMKLLSGLILLSRILLSSKSILCPSISSSGALISSESIPPSSSMPGASEKPGEPSSLDMLTAGAERSICVVCKVAQKPPCGLIDFLIPISKQTHL